MVRTFLILLSDLQNHWLQINILKIVCFLRDESSLVDSSFIELVNFI